MRARGILAGGEAPAGRAMGASPASASTTRATLHATLLVEGGIELAVVSQALGHTDLPTTAHIYANLTPTMLERSATGMDRTLGKG